MTPLSFLYLVHQQSRWLCLCQVPRLTSPLLLHHHHPHHHRTQSPRDSFNFLLMTALDGQSSGGNWSLMEGGCFLPCPHLYT